MTLIVRTIKADNMAKWLNNKAKLAEIDGMDREKVNKTIIDAIVLSAYELKDPDVLDVLDSVVTGTGKLGGSIAAREAVFDARAIYQRLLLMKKWQQVRHSHYNRRSLWRMQKLTSQA